MITYACQLEHRWRIGGFTEVYKWGACLVSQKPQAVAKIYRIRGGDKYARVIGEITHAGYTEIHTGRYLRIKNIKRYGGNR